MVQQPESTEYDSMPRSAIATGLADYVLLPQEMPAKLAAYVQHAFPLGGGHKLEPVLEDTNTLEKILAQLHVETGHDFSLYKRTAIARRVQRRMALHQITKFGDYLRLMRDDSREVHGLFHDLLIGVTRFFRDPAAFAALQEQIDSHLVAAKPLGDTIRMWVCGCATGEEAYSLAIVLLEQLESRNKRPAVQLFATDIDERAIQQARSGVFPPSIANDVSAARLARFFVQDRNSGGYRIAKRVRDLLVFSVQDVHRDPPFSKLDLISCRNVLIYMDKVLQKKIIRLFHYALKPTGVLFLGSSETVGEFATHFTTLDRKHKLYARQHEAPATLSQGVTGKHTGRLEGHQSFQVSQGNNDRHDKVSNKMLMEQALVQYYAKTAVLVDAQGEVLHIHGRTGKYLEPAPGDAAFNILRMARQGLLQGLTEALRRAHGQGEVVTCPGLRVRTNGGATVVDLIVKPVRPHQAQPVPRQVYLVLLEEQSPSQLPSSECSAETGTADKAPEGTSDGADVQVVALQQALQAKEEHLQSTVEEMETANEELKSTNEELQSVNEELQSANEEMETSKEELQSVNEELTTVNAELQSKLADLSQANNDMSNLLAGTGVATLFLDQQLRISRFTPATTEVINLIPTDVGRPVAHIASNLVGYQRLVVDAQLVLDTLAPQETEVQTRAGAWYLMRISPYRTLEKVVDGAVLTFVDITTLKQAQQALAKTRDFAQAIVETVRQPLLVLNDKQRVISANPAFFRVFGVSAEETEGRLLCDLGDGQWNIPRLRELLDDILCHETPLEDYEVTHEFPEVGKRTMRLNGRRIHQEHSEDDLVLLAIEDITEYTV
jgi:two-component system CheB/CheR fusion protein